MISRKELSDIDKTFIKNSNKTIVREKQINALRSGLGINYIMNPKGNKHLINTHSLGVYRSFALTKYFDFFLFS